MSRCAAAPSVVSNSRPDVITSRRPTYVRPGTLGRRWKTVGRPSGAPRLTTYPSGLLSASQTVRAGRTMRPSTVTRWRSGSADWPKTATAPSTFTRPARISSSALRREVTPARARARCRRINVIPVLRPARAGGARPTIRRAAATLPTPSSPGSPETAAWSRRGGDGPAPRRPPSAGRVPVSPASGSSVARSSSVSGRLAANSAASSSCASGLTTDHHGGERFGLLHLAGPTLGELEQGDERRQDLHHPRPGPDHVDPPELLALGEQRGDPRGRAFDVQRPRHHTVQHRLGDERDDALGGGEQVVEVDLERRRRQIRGGLLEAAAEAVGPLLRRVMQPSHQVADLLGLEPP